MKSDFQLCICQNYPNFFKIAIQPSEFSPIFSKKLDQLKTSQSFNFSKQNCSKYGSVDLDLEITKIEKALLLISTVEMSIG